MHRVYFIRAARSGQEKLARKLSHVCRESALLQHLTTGSLVAVKTRFSEQQPPHAFVLRMVQGLVRLLQAQQLQPFVTDCQRLSSRSSNAVSLLHLAQKRGYSHHRLGAPVCMADGLRGTDVRDIRIPGGLFQHVPVATGIALSDALVVVSHVRPSPACGYEGALCNLADCAAHARTQAEETGESLQKQLMEHCLGVVADKRQRALFINLVLHVQAPGRTSLLFPNIGMLVSADPVAIDTATLYLIKDATGKRLRDLAFSKDYTVQLQYSQSLGLGTIEFELVEISL